MSKNESKFIQRARKIIRENPEVFRALEEYDKTRRLPKLSYKIRATFTIDEDIFKKFHRYCEREGYAMSKIVEKLIREEMKKRRSLS